MNRFIKTGGFFILCTAASVSLAAPNEKAYVSNDNFSDAINGYMNWGQADNSGGVMRVSMSFLRRADLPSTSDDFFTAINDSMNMEETEIAAVEPVSEGQADPVYSGRENRISGYPDYFDATPYEPNQ